MKVAVVVGDFPKLSETFILYEIIELIKMGVDIQILALSEANEDIYHKEVDEFNLRNRTIYLSRNRKGKKIAKYFVLIINFIKCLLMNPRMFYRIVLYKKHILRNINWFASLNCRDEKYDIIYCHFGYNALKILPLVKLEILHGNLFVVFHGVDISKHIKIYGESLYKELFGSVSGLLPISNLWLSRLIELGADIDKTRVHRMGIPLDETQYRIPKKTGQINSISLCRLVEKKGIEIAIRALYRLKNEINFKYRIIGDGILKDQIQRMIDDLELNDSISLEGSLRHNAVYELMNASDILLAPSHEALDGDKEGIPVTIMESMGIGLVVVSTTHSGIPELVDDGETGFLAIEKNVQSFEMKIKEAVNSDWDLITKKARRKIEEEYTVKGNVNELVQLFHETNGKKSDLLL